MADYQSEHDKYVKDSRMPCKYGVKCYQKNPVHHQKYKHPPEKGGKFKAKHAVKKLKVETDKKEIKEVVSKNDVSDSDDYNIEDDSGSGSNKAGKHREKRINNDVSDSDSDDTDISGCKKEDDVSDSDITDADEHEVSKKSTDLEEMGIKAKENENIMKPTTHESESESKSSQKEEQIEQINHPLSHEEFIKQKFLVEMPKDFYQFWEFCKRLNSNNPQDALKDVGLYLVGPYDVLAGKFNKVHKSSDEYLVHWRYYHDPPEMQTVLKGDVKTGYHIGYFRDTPEALPVFLVGNHAKKDGVLIQLGGNIFSALNLYLEELKKSGDPFKKMHIGKIQRPLQGEAEKLKIDLSRKTDAMIARDKKIVTRTFNKIGLVVPYNRKSQLGWRELALGNKELATLFTKLQNALPDQRSTYLSTLQPVFTYASIAADECDFGTGIELGWNIISHGLDTLNNTALNFLASNYRLLKREAFARIAEAHMKNRKKGCDLSII